MCCNRGFSYVMNESAAAKSALQAVTKLSRTSKCQQAGGHIMMIQHHQPLLTSAMSGVQSNPVVCCLLQCLAQAGHESPPSPSFKGQTFVTKCSTVPHKVAAHTAHSVLAALCRCCTLTHCSTLSQVDHMINLQQPPAWITKPMHPIPPAQCIKKQRIDCNRRCSHKAYKQAEMPCQLAGVTRSCWAMQGMLGNMAAQKDLCNRPSP
jgi:hypothetical protein